MHPNRFGAAPAALLLILIAAPRLAIAQTEPPRTLSLAQALDLARERSPLLEAARARIAEADGNLTQASLLLVDNPELALAAGPRFLSQPGGGSELDAEIQLAQRFETGGQRRHRIARAEALANASRARSADVERVVSQAVASVFYEVLAASERLRLNQDNAALAESLYDIAHARVAAGAAAPLEENTARIRRAEATRQLVRAETALENAKLRLVTTLGLDSATALQLEGTLPESTALPSLQDLLTSAAKSHPRLLDAAATVDASESASALAKAEAWPDLSLGVLYAREERDDIVMGGLTIPIPLFNRNQGERQRARAATRRAAASARSVRLEVDSEIRRNYSVYEAATRAVAAFDADVLRSQQENLVLIETMFQAGKIRYVDVLLLQRELVEGRLGYLDARLELALAEIAARAAAGLEPAPYTTGRILP